MKYGNLIANHARETDANRDNKENNHVVYVSIYRLPYITTSRSHPYLSRVLFSRHIEVPVPTLKQKDIPWHKKIFLKQHRTAPPASTRQ